MNSPIRVKITKLSGKKKASLPVGFWVDGVHHAGGPAVGWRFYLSPINNTSMVQQPRWDWFCTTEVKKIEGNIFITQNSKWRYEEIKT